MSTGLIDKAALRGEVLSVPEPIVSVADGEVPDLKMLVYGNPGMGKTVFLGSAILDPRTSPAIMLDLEAGTRSIASKCRYVTVADLGNPQEGKIDVVRLREWKDVQSIYNFLFDAKSKSKRASYKSLLIDSLTEINYMSLRHAMNTATTPQLETGIPEMRDYLKTNTQMKEMLRAFRDLQGLHVFYSALPQDKADKSGGLSEIKPSLIGKLTEEAMAIVDVVGYMRVDMKKQREMLFQPEGRYTCKDRSEGGALGKEISDPTITKVLDLLRVK